MAGPRAVALLVCALYMCCAARSRSSTPSDAFDCASPPAVPRDRRPDTTRLRVAHWNAEWLFLRRLPPRWPTAAAAEAHLLAVARVLRTVDADLVSLAEVEDCAVLRRLIAAIGDATYAPYLLRGTDSATGQNVALLTRIDPAEPLWRSAARAPYPLRDTPCASQYDAQHGTTGVSKHFVTSINASGLGPIVLMACHLLAHPERACARREAQALVLQGVLRDLMSTRRDARFIVMGDMNDYDLHVPDVANSMPVSRTLQMMKDIVQGPGYEGDELYNAAAAVEQGERYTAYYDRGGRRSGVCKRARDASTSIDHVLISKTLQDSHVVTRIDNALFPPPCAADEPVSDHWPVVVELRSKST